MERDCSKELPRKGLLSVHFRSCSGEVGELGKALTPQELRSSPSMASLREGFVPTPSSPSSLSLWEQGLVGVSLAFVVGFLLLLLLLERISWGSMALQRALSKRGHRGGDSRCVANPTSLRANRALCSLDFSWRESLGARWRWDKAPGHRGGDSLPNFCSNEQRALFARREVGFATQRESPQEILSNNNKSKRNAYEAPAPFFPFLQRSGTRGEKEAKSKRRELGSWACEASLQSPS